MKIRVNYTDYQNNEEATRWSKLKGYLAAYSLFIVIALTALFDKILLAFTGDYDSSLVIALVLAIAATIGAIVLCAKMEHKHASIIDPGRNRSDVETDERSPKLNNDHRP